MANSLLNIIVQRLFYHNLQCRRLISSDGITTRNFTIDSLHGIFEGVSIDAQLSRRNILSLGNTLSIAKNLDEYQFKICLEIPSIPDSDPVKLQLQKFRIAIIASFAILGMRLMSSDANKELRKWNSFATVLLRKTSEFVTNLKANKRSVLENYDDSHLQETFEFFEVPIRDIGKALANIYY
jgi:hypothetical protein